MNYFILKIEYKLETVERFRVVLVTASGGFGKFADGSIHLEGPVRMGTWWHKYFCFQRIPPLERERAPDPVGQYFHYNNRESVMNDIPS
jgi:hypothetical protein